MPRSLTVISTEQNRSTYQLFTPQWETMLTCRQLACFTSSKYPADLFVQSKNKKNWSNQNGKLKRRVKTPLGNTPLYFASYFFATLSSEVVGRGRRHVCVWADRVRAFLWTSRSLSLSLSFRLEPPREKETQQTTAAIDSASKRAREQGAASGESFQSKRLWNDFQLFDVIHAACVYFI